MKRSEAEKLINDWLDTATIITGESVIEFLTLKIGMLPPRRECEYSGLIIDENSWEPENETK